MSRRVAIKVCGITEQRDAVEAVHLGVDVLGFDFREESPRYVDPELVRRIVERLPVFVATVGVFADAALTRMLDTARRTGIGLIQFHGAEEPSTCATVAPFRWIKAFRVDAGFDPEELGRFATTTYLLDARVDPAAAPAPPFEWRRARAFGMYGRIVISGNLEPAHVGMAIEDARPYALDVLEEAEVAPGKKDLDRLELIVDAVRRAERRIAGES